MAGTNSLEAASNEGIGINRDVGILPINRKNFCTRELEARLNGDKSNKKRYTQIQAVLSNPLVEHFARSQSDQGTQPRRLRMLQVQYELLGFQKSRTIEPRAWEDN